MSNVMDRVCVSDLTGCKADINNQKLQFQWNLKDRNRSNAPENWGVRLMNSLEIAQSQWAANANAALQHEAA